MLSNSAAHPAGDYGIVESSRYRLYCSTTAWGQPCLNRRERNEKDPSDCLGERVPLGEPSQRSESSGGRDRADV